MSRRMFVMAQAWIVPLGVVLLLTQVGIGRVHAQQAQGAFPQPTRNVGLMDSALSRRRLLSEHGGAERRRSSDPTRDGDFQLEVWMKDNWPYLVAFGVLGGLIATYAITRSQVSDDPAQSSLVFRFGPQS